MTGVRQVGWFVAGLSAATLLALVFQAPPVAAQGLRGTTGDSAWPTTVTRRPNAPEPDTRDAAPDLGLDPDPAARPSDPDATPADDDPQRPAIGRPAVVDGDPNWPPEPRAPQDGVIDTGPKDGPVEAVDPTRRDTRSDEDIAAFERPAAGFDADAFAVEFEPILDRRPTRLYRFEPFTPVGTKIGSMVLFTELESDVAAFGNVLHSSVKPRSDVSLEVRPTVRLVSNWRTHALEFRATGLSSFHAGYPSEDDRAYQLEARGRIDITRRTNIEAIASQEVTQEQRGSINALTTAGERADVTTSRIGLSANHRFNRLTLQLRGTVTDTEYSGGAAGGTTTRDRNFVQNEVTLRASYEFKPSLAVFAETAFNTRDHEAVSADGFSRDSSGERYRAGVSFGNGQQRLRGEVALGYAVQRPDDGRLPSIDGVIVDANLAIRMSALTTVLLSARTDITESTVTNSSGALTHGGGVELRHAFTKRLIATTGLRYTRSDYKGISVNERQLDATLGAEYFLNRHVTLFGRYLHTDFETSDTTRNFTADEVRVGVRVRR